MTFFATLKEAQYYCQSYYDDDNQLRNCTCGVCPGGKQPEIKKFRKDFTYIGKEGRDWKAMPRDVESFLNQALTKAYEAGQKSREKEIVEVYNKALGDMFIKIAELAEPDERQPNPGELHTNMDDIFEIKEALSKKEL